MISTCGRCYGSSTHTPCFCHFNEIKDLNFQYLPASAKGTFLAPGAHLLCHLWGKQYEPKSQHTLPQTQSSPNKYNLSLSPSGITMPGICTGCQNLSSRTEPQWSTVVTCLKMHYLLAAFSPYFTSLLPSKYPHLPKRCLHIALYPRVYLWEPKSRHHVSHFFCYYYLSFWNVARIMHIILHGKNTASYL